MAYMCLTTQKNIKCKEEFEDTKGAIRIYVHCRREARSYQ